MNRQNETSEAADALADAKAWLASMETTLRRVAQQATSDTAQTVLVADTQAQALLKKAQSAFGSKE